jgi:LysM repeat protein
MFRKLTFHGLPKSGLTVFALVLSLALSANSDRILRNQYIDMWKEEAVYQMAAHKIPASIKLAQAIIESGDGNSKLARTANNHFGIKCHSDWQGEKVYHDDDAKGECFRKYTDARQSFDDHSVFLKRPRYSSLFDLKINDYKGWAQGLKDCGYATSPTYAAQLIKVIEENNLAQYDEEGLKFIKKGTLPEGRESQSGPIAIAEKPKTKGPKEEATTIKLGSARNVSLSKNGIKYTVAKPDDTVAGLAHDLDMMPWQIKKYNDIDDNYRFKAEETIYLQPKKRKAKVNHHIVKEGETLWKISQEHGIRLKSIYKFNGLATGSVLQQGQKIYLTGKSPALNKSRK